MDPNVALIVGALAAAVANQMTPAVKDVYNGLKSIIQRRYADNAQIQGALDGIEEDPETWEPPLAKSLEKAGAGEDEEIVAAAQQLQTALQQTGVNIAVTGNTQTGNNNVQQNIGQVSGGTVIGRQTNRGTDDD